MAFTAKDVKVLREMTGVGMMDCKKALTETGGNKEEAVLYLREKGLAAAQKKAGRITAEGIAYAGVFDDVGIVIEVNSETDFVAKNEMFNKFVENAALAVALNSPADVDALMTSKYPDSQKTVAEHLQELILVIGENLSVRRFMRYDDGISIPYIHAGGKIGVIINLEASGISDMDAITELGKDLAMQTAAMRPLYLDSSSVDPEKVKEEEKIQLTKALEENKVTEEKTGKKLPEDKALKIAENKVKGRMNKFFEEVCLLNQPYVKESKLTVEKYVAQVAKTLGGSIKIKAFTRFEKGEGIEKKEDDFAAEVASMVG